MRIERISYSFKKNICRAYYCTTIITLIVCTILWQISSNPFPSSLFILSTISASLILFGFCFSYLLPHQNRRIQTPDKQAPLFPIAPPLIPEINSYCTLPELAKLAQVNHAGQRHFNKALQERVQFFGCTNPKQSKNYYQSICEEIVVLCKAKVIPQNLIIYKQKKFFKKREINAEATLFNLKFLNSEQIFNICSLHIPYHYHISQYLIKLTKQNILQHDGVSRRIAVSILNGENDYELLISHGGNLNDPALMLWAAQNGNTDLIRRNLANGGDIGNQDLLRASILGGHIETVRFLLESGLDGRTFIELAVQNAARTRDERIIDLLLNFYHQSTLNFGSSLPFVAANGSFRLVCKLIRRGANPNVIDQFGNSALCYAARGGFVKMVKFLLRHGALPNQIGQRGRTPLMYAMNTNSFWTIADLLLSRNANIHATDGMGNALIHHFVQKGWWNGINALMQRGANLNQPGAQGNLPLHFAVEYGAERNRRFFGAHTQIISVQKNLVLELLKHPSIDVNAPNSIGISPLSRAAAECCDIAVIHALIDRGANVNLQGYRNITALMSAMHGLLNARQKNIAQNQLAIMKTLLENGANPNLRNYRNRRVLYYARRYEKDFKNTPQFCSGTVSLLRKYGAIL